MNQDQIQAGQMRRLAAKQGVVFRTDRRRGFEWGGSRYPFGVFHGGHGGLVDVADEDGLDALMDRWRD